MRLPAAGRRLDRYQPSIGSQRSTDTAIAHGPRSTIGGRSTAALAASQNGRKRGRGVGHKSNNVFLGTAGLPPEEQIPEHVCDILPARRVFALLVSEAAEAKAAFAERFKKTQRGVVSAAVADMESVLLQRRAECLLKK